MFAQVQLFPEQASTIAPRVDALTLGLVAISAFFSAIIFATLIYFAVKYRRRSEGEVPRPTVASMKLEVTWTVIPLLITLGIYAWGADVYFEMARPPDDA